MARRKRKRFTLEDVYKAAEITPYSEEAELSDDEAEYEKSLERCDDSSAKSRLWRKMLKGDNG